MINGRTKGSNNERDVAKMLSKAWGVGFHRTPMSGGLGWGKGNNISGDIVPPSDINFPLTIECKAVEEDWSFDRMLLSTSLFTDWWEQSERDAKTHGKVPCVIFKKNRRKHWISLKTDDMNKLEKTFSMRMDLTIINYGSKISVVLLEEFLNLVSIADLNDLV